MRLYCVSVWGRGEVSLDVLYTVHPHCQPDLFHFILTLQVNFKSQRFHHWLCTRRHAYSPTQMHRTLHRTLWKANAGTLVCQCFLATTHSLVNRVNKTIWKPTRLYFRCGIKSMHTHICVSERDTFRLGWWLKALTFLQIDILFLLSLSGRQSQSEHEIIGYDQWGSRRTSSPSFPGTSRNPQREVALQQNSPWQSQEGKDWKGSSY